MAYSTKDDLLLGQIPLPSYLDPDTYISNAAEEIDAIIGMTYVTPVSIQETPQTRPTKLILKKVNNFLASGRIIMALDSGGEDTQLHSYGRYLVTQAEAIIKQIASGDVTLVGAQPINSGGNGNAPVIVNGDAASIVDTFYDNFNQENWPDPRRRAWFDGRAE
ncbi:hypothetical protein [Streptomyces sp. NPDC127100]|uniref:hypothetical protein n=1 Tax=Streptomyces sp. NPDC127100 TaxID=3347138 RepID=UPI00364FBF97